MPKFRIAAVMITASLAVILTLGGSSCPSSAQTFTNPLFVSEDPWVIKVGPMYYFPESNTPGLRPDQICLRAATSLTGLANARPQPVWTPPVPCGTGPGANCHEIWSPRIVRLLGHWYIYYSADDGDNRNHRTFVIESSKDDSPWGPYFVPENGLPHAEMTTPDNHWAINGVPFSASDGGLYFVWSGGLEVWPFSQCTYIARMRDPLHIVGKRVRIATPTEPWETRTAPIEEGQFPFLRDGVNFIIYSGSASWTTDYSVGLLTNRTKDILNPSAWKKTGPIFDHTAKTYGPGSTVLVASPDGTETWNVYHAIDAPNCRPNAYSCRDIRMQKMSWNADGSPNLGVPIDPHVTQKAPSGDPGLVPLH